MTSYVDQFLSEKNEPEPEKAAPAEPPRPEAPEDYDLLSHVIEALHTIHDPEIPADIYELGLIYKARAGTDGHVLIEMTLTTPNCPVAESMPAEVEAAMRAIPGVTSVHIEIVWDPPWTPDLMSEAARLEIGFL